MSQSIKFSQLVVEGKDDRHVIWSLCQEYQLPETFKVEIANTKEDSLDGGVDQLLNSITVRLKARGLQNLGIVVDADTDINARWQSIRDRLTKAGYIDIPEEPGKKGTIIEQEELPRIGIWIMPDNQLSGMLENFVAHLIPDKDRLAVKANQIIRQIEKEKIHRYIDTHRSKAFIHTWLAWQEKPGRPMGQSITAHLLDPKHPLARTFMDWLSRLFLSE